MTILFNQIAARLGIKIDQVLNVIIWGNHSSTQYPDVNHGTVTINGSQVPIREAVKDDDYLNGDFIKVGSCVISNKECCYVDMCSDLHLYSYFS